MLILRYLQASFRQGAIPWHFFQLNSDYFNVEKGIFSKLEIDHLIPRQWRLAQAAYDAQQIPAAFPVFAKPEWGQNAKGITRLDNEVEFKTFAAVVNQAKVPYIIQQAASGHREFEVYYLRSPEQPDGYESLHITEVLNNAKTQHPINSVNNPETSYYDITDSFSSDQLGSLWDLVKNIGQFKMARLCLKADSSYDIPAGQFEVVEINIFLPMPLILLADNVSDHRKKKLMQKMMDNAARLVTTIPKGKKNSIFFRKMAVHYRI